MFLSEGTLNLALSYGNPVTSSLPISTISASVSRPLFMYSSFGMENMPFIILLTSIFQAIVWRFKLETYILKLVPHYLVEGLLAGVGLKIALKFIPFLYDIEHETDTWLNFEREITIGLSLLSFGLFVLLFKYYKKKMPALPYFVIMASSVLASFYLPLPKLSISTIPFELALPLPHLDHLNGTQTLFMFIKMIGFAMMPGTIDVIEQVMSNVAIEKMDPDKRKCDTNNSLLAIWIGNAGATFFGGMTNLDGLPKSTTNAVAGAKTKLSNLVTSIFLLIVVLNPSLITALSEYGLGIIMVYSGWKMIANISHVQAEGRYALILAGVCGFMVFELGIFEGLLAVLLGHAIIQFIFMKRLGKNNQQIFTQFKQSISSKQHFDLEQIEMLNEPDVPVLNKWMALFNSKGLNGIMTLYDNNAVLVPSFSTRIRKTTEEIKDYYQTMFTLNELQIFKEDVVLNTTNNIKIDRGHYQVSWVEQGIKTAHHLSFLMVVNKNKIMAHNSSLFSNDSISISRWIDDKKEGNYLL